jgi:hypothetical protein
MELSEPAILTQRQEFLAARSGRPAGANDPFFADLKGEVAEKGFLVAAADDLIAWARTRSLMPPEHRPVRAAAATRSPRRDQARPVRLLDHLTR